MASWVWTKLKNLFVPDDVSISRELVASLSLPNYTSQFVHALTDPRNPSSSIVYMLSVERLSERSIEDIHALVAAVNPKSVVVLVDDTTPANVSGEEENLLEGSEALQVPTSALDVLKKSFVERSKASVYESRAGLRLLISIFGTTFHGTTIAAKNAAENVKATFEYFCFPSIANSVLVKEDEALVAAGSEPAETTAEISLGESDSSSVSVLDRFSKVLGGILGGDGHSESLTGSTHKVGRKSLSASFPQELRVLASSLASTLSNSDLPFLALASEAKSDSASDQHHQQPSVEELEADCPPFALTFYPIFLDLHELYRETPFVNQALGYAKNLLKSVDNGDDVDLEDLARARAFRVAVESVRLSWNSYNYRQASSKESRDFARLSYEDKCYALLAQGLKYQGEKSKTVVAVVNASSIPGIRKHWNTPVPAEVLAYAEHCFFPVNPGDSEEDIGLFKSIRLETPETKAAVVVSAGAAAAVGLISLPSVSTVVKILTFKVPTVLKIFLLQAKRTAVVYLSNAVTPASKVLVPALKAVGSGNVAVPSGAVKAVALKGIISAEKARMAAHSVVAAAERASLQAIRTAFYSLMKNRQAKRVGPRPWLMLVGTLTTAAGVWCYGDGIEHAIGIVPAAPAIARLGRGLEKLDQTADAVHQVEGSIVWQRIYARLYDQRTKS